MINLTDLPTMNKKATSLIMTIFEILVVIIITYGTMNMAYGYAKSDTVQKANIAEDIRMWVDTLSALPGDSIVEYPKDLSAYTVIMDNKKVMVLRKGDPDLKKAERDFILPVMFTASGATENVDHVCLEKTKTKIFLRQCRPGETVLNPAKNQAKSS
jgi:hypothetical protein